MDTIERGRSKPRTKRGRGRGMRGFNPRRVTTCQETALVYLAASEDWRGRQWLRQVVMDHRPVEVSVGAFARQLRAMVHAGAIEVREVGGEVQYRLKEGFKWGR